MRYPLMTAKVAAAIYFQALKLWWKGATFYPHPARKFASEQAHMHTDQHEPQSLGNMQ